MQGNTKNIPEREREMQVRSSSDHLQLTWPLGSPWQEPAQPEDDGPLVLLHHLKQAISIDKVQILCEASVHCDHQSQPLCSGSELLVMSSRKLTIFSC